MNRMIDWFARNSVAANLLMMFVIVSGCVAIFSLNSQVFPEISLDRISIQVPYLGAGPEEVEEAVIVRVEESILGVEGIKEIVSTASEGSGSVLVELELTADPRRVLDEIKSRVDAIATFPEETEKPIIRELTNNNQVVDLAISGTVGEFALKAFADQIRNELSIIPEISQVEIMSARAYEISIEVSESALRRHELTFDDIATAVRRSSLDLPGGSVRSDGGEILLRTIGQAYRGEEYEKLVLLTRADGTRLQLGEVATVVDGFVETDQSARFDGSPTIMISVFRTGNQGALEIAEKVNEYVQRAQLTLPEGISLTVWQDTSQVLRARLNTMLRTGMSGYLLVFIVLALFLEFRLAFWVSLGIPISFLGGLALMPSLDVTTNVISLFAFILVLGIVVDDAIIVGENIFTHQETDGNGVRSSITGAQEIAKPVVFAILTTIAAFMPLLFVPGMIGKMFRVIPLVVIPCLIFSLIESLNILPAHLSLIPKRKSQGPWTRFQQKINRGLKKFIRTVYAPMLESCLHWRYLTAAVGISCLVLTGGLVLGGRTAFQFFPSVEADFMIASITLPQGVPVSSTAAAVNKLEIGAERLRATLREETGEDYFRHMYAAIGSQPMSSRGGAMQTGAAIASTNVGEVIIELVPSQYRALNSEQLGNRWRELTGQIPEAVDITFDASAMSPGGADVDVMLSGPNIDQLRAAAEEIKARLNRYAGVYEITDSFRAGKEEMQLGITPAAETLGLTLQDLGRQVRQAFYGEEAQRIQRGRDDIRVMVRYPLSDRRSLGDLENMRIRTPEGGEVPFRQVAAVETGRGFASIKRVDRYRAVNVSATLDEGVTSSGAVIGELQTSVLPEVLAKYPSIVYTFQGMQEAQQESLAGLQIGFSIGLLGIFALLAIPLRSYIQPLIIMTAIPFGLVGAVWGHLLMGVSISVMSMFGLVALSGVVVNDSLIMVTFINQKRQQATDLSTAVRQAGVARFRAILLTSLTTFFGLLPLMLQGGFEAAFLLPMAISLGFGVLFATLITLIIVPTTYMLLEDMKQTLRNIFSLNESAFAEPVAVGTGIQGTTKPQNLN